jgi:hypothetical protein
MPTGVYVRRPAGVKPANAITGHKVGILKRDLVRRMGLRMNELSWQGQELLDLYCRTRAHVVACDDYFSKTPIVGADDGKVPEVARFYLNAIKTSITALGELRQVVSEMAKEDTRMDDALSALASEGQKARTSKATVGA